MEAVKLAGLKPAKVFAYFEKLCSIPHGSGNIRAISDYLVSFAREHHIRCVQDKAGDVIFYKPGSAGYENHPPVILQGHMDMVCEKEPDCPLDMAVDGLDVTHDGEFVFARGTTLGGDDGIAVAYAMALLTDDTIAHPPLEVIITVDEETGMTGAKEADLSLLQGTRLINLDSEDEGVFTVACAGGATVVISLPAPRRAVYGPCIRLTVEGLRSGHSGVEIGQKRANANKVMGEFLGRVQKLMPLCLTAISGGTKTNVITGSCEATLVAMGIRLERINDVARELQEEVRREYDEPNAIVRADDVDALGGNAMSTQDTAKVIALMCAAPNGVQAMSQEMPGLVQTSLNMGVVRMGETVDIAISIRSSVNEEKLALVRRLEDLTAFHGGTCTLAGQYPAWEYLPDSPLRATMVKTYTDLYGKAPEVVAIHAGLECGLFKDRRPELDCVSIGPQMHDIHTSRERLDIASVQRTWEFLLAVLKAL